MDDKHVGDGDRALNPVKMFGGLSSARDLSDQLDALALEDDDDDDDAFDPMNISDFLNSKGDLTGLSEWNDSEFEGSCKSKQDKERRRRDPVGNLRSAADSPCMALAHPNSKDKYSTPSNPKYCMGQTHDLKSGCSSQAFPNSGLIKIKIPSGSETTRRASTEHTCARTPNFRTPGGYKPPLVEKEPRNLTNEEIIREVKEMYAEDRLCAVYPVTTSEDKNKDSLGFLLNNSHFPERDRVDRKLVFEPEIIKSASWVCGTGPEKNIYGHGDKDPDAIVNDFAHCSTLQEATNYVSSNRHSLHTRTENLAQLSRLWTEIQDTKQKLEHDINLLANPGSPGPAATSSPKQNQEKDKSGSIIEPCQHSAFPTVPRSFSFGKRAFTGSVASEIPKFEGRSIRANDGGGDSADLETTRSPEKVRPKRTVRSKGKVQQRHRQRPTGTTQALVPFIPRSNCSEDELGLEQNEINEILEETDLHDSDFDDILSEISDHVPDVGFAGVQNFFKQTNTNSILDFHSNDIPFETCKQKYFEERYRRVHCENEISKLQKELLEASEKLAIVDGILSGKETSITKLNKVVERLRAQLKSQAKATISKLAEIRQENAELQSAVKESRDQISVYKEELDKAFKLNEGLKANVEEAVNELENQERLGKEQKEKIQAQVDSLEASISTLQAEKESSLRALRDCQDALDTTKQFFSATSEELQRCKAEHEIQDEKLWQLENDHVKLKSETLSMENEKSRMASRIIDLESETFRLKSDKALLETEFRQKIAEEREKLHEYYNSKIKEILHTESEKMIAAEKEFMDSHERKLEQVEVEARERLEKMRTKYTHQLQQMKIKFEAQLESLKKENEEKSKLIGTVAEQLRNFSERDQEAVGRDKFSRKSLSHEKYESLVSSEGIHKSLSKFLGSCEF